jgi:hypothetical protein
MKAGSEPTVDVYRLEWHNGTSVVRAAESAERLPARLFRPIKRRMHAAIVPAYRPHRTSF